MNITDIFNNSSSKKINEAIEKTFGQKLNLEAFTIEQLEDSRNRLRTQIYTVRNSSGFNETVENESYTKAQWMLDAINAEVMQREEFDEAKEEKFDPLKHVKNPTPGEKKAAKDVKRGSYGDRAAMLRSAEADGRLKEDDIDEAGFGRDDEFRNQERNAGLEHETNNIAIAINGKTWKVVPGKGYADSPEERNYLAGMKRWAETKSASSGKKWSVHLTGANTTESIEQNINNGEDMTQVRESATDKASAVVTAKTMVDRVGRWIEELAGMENDTLLSLGDTIRDEMGQEEAKNFLSNVAPAIQQALTNLKATRETLATGVRGLTGEEQSAEIIGSETPSVDGELGDAGEEIAPVGPDEMNTGEEEIDVTDEFAASEPATGGMEIAGRAQRESIDRSGQLLRVLAG